MMNLTVKTNKKYDYKLSIKPVIDNEAENILPNARGMNYQFHGRYIRENGEQVYNGTVKYFKNKAAAIRCYMKKMNEVIYEN